MFHALEALRSLSFPLRVHNFALHFAMERLFSPCTRLRDMLESKGRRGPNELSLQEIKLDVSAEDLLSAERAFTYVDLYAMLEKGITLAWLTPHTAVARDDGRVMSAWERSGMDEEWSIRFNADGNDIDAMATSPEHLMTICDVVLRVLAASVVHSVTLDNWNYRDGALINSASLAYLMEQCQSLKVLTLQHSAWDENHIHVLGVHSRPDLEIVLIRCNLTRAGTSALAEILGRNQGPTKLDRCDVDNIVLADGLRGNSRLRSLESNISFNSPQVEDQQVLAIASALKENRGLVHWNLGICSVSEVTWGALCDSLKTHPTLEVLDLRYVHTADSMTPAGMTSNLQALLDMIKVNMSIHTIHLHDLHDRFTEYKLFRESVIPYLESNRLRPRLLAIQKTRPIAYRVGVLGRALLSTRTDANNFWMLLSGNAEVASYLSTTATTTPAASLPTPPTAATSVNAKPGNK
jgi:hypothetical protein